MFSTVLALGLIIYVSQRAEYEIVLNLASVTSLLLLAVFTIVNIACLVLRRDGDSGHFRSPGITPAIAAVLCAFLLGPWVDRDALIYQIAAGLMLVGVVLWVITYFTSGRRTLQPARSATLSTFRVVTLGTRHGNAP